MEGTPPTPEQPVARTASVSGDETTLPRGGEPAPASLDTSTRMSTGASGSDVPATPTPAQAAAQGTLEQEIGRLTRHGYVIVDRGPTSVQLKRHKHFSVWWALFWFIFVPGGGLLIYLAWYVLIKRDRIAFLRVTPEGRVMLSES